MINARIVTLLIITFFVFTSCKRKDCTDVDASNYNAKATKDDQSCQYTGSAIIWFDSLQAQDFSDSTIYSVQYFLNDKSIGAIGISDYTGTPPSCQSPKGITTMQDLGKLKKKTFELKVKEMDGTLISTHSFNMEANTCVAFQIP